MKNKNICGCFQYCKKLDINDVKNYINLVQFFVDNEISEVPVNLKNNKSKYIIKLCGILTSYIFFINLISFASISIKNYNMTNTSISKKSLTALKRSPLIFHKEMVFRTQLYLVIINNKRLQ